MPSPILFSHLPPMLQPVPLILLVQLLLLLLARQSITVTATTAPIMITTLPHPPTTTSSYSHQFPTFSTTPIPPGTPPTTYWGPWCEQGASDWQMDAVLVMALSGLFCEKIAERGNGKSRTRPALRRRRFLVRYLVCEGTTTTTYTNLAPTHTHSLLPLRLPPHHPSHRPPRLPHHLTSAPGIHPRQPHHAHAVRPSPDWRILLPPATSG